MRLVILCEGQTEKAVLKDFLAPFCTGFQRVDVVNAGGVSKLIKAYPQLAATELEADETAVVFCLIDLLNSGVRFPKKLDASTDPYFAQVQYIQTHFAMNIRDALRPRFFAFAVMMELEAWLLADEQALNAYFKPPQPIKRPHNPETILKPAEQLKWWARQFRNEDYVKTLHGRRLFALADAKRVYEDNCKQFIAIIDTMLDLQGKPSSKKGDALINSEIVKLDALFAEISQKHEQLWRQLEQQAFLTDADCEAIEKLERELEEIAQRRATLR